eukprot:362414-Chlamydomonas_euryale.AAC.3
MFDLKTQLTVHVTNPRYTGHRVEWGGWRSEAGTWLGLAGRLAVTGQCISSTRCFNGTSNILACCIHCAECMWGCCHAQEEGQGEEGRMADPAPWP